MVLEALLYPVGIVVSFVSILLYLVLKILVVILLSVLTIVVAVFVLPVWLISRVGWLLGKGFQALSGALASRGGE